MLLIWVHVVSTCRQSVARFIENDAHEMNDVDLSIARLRLLPFYEQWCPHLRSLLETYDEQLTSEHLRRHYEDSTKTEHAQQHD